VVAVHRHKQDPAGAWVQRVRPPQELHAVHAGQVQVRRQQRHLVAAVGQPRQRVETGVGSIRSHHLVVGPEAARQRRLSHGAGLRIGVHDKQHRGARRGRAAGPITCAHASVLLDDGPGGTIDLSLVTPVQS
jgi:hypothetical protein